MRTSPLFQKEEARTRVSFGEKGARSERFYNLSDPNAPLFAGKMEGSSGDLGFAAGALARAGSNASGASVATVALERGLFGGVVTDSDLSAIYRFVAAGIEPEARSAAQISIQLTSDEPLPANGVQVPDDFDSIFELTDEEIGAINESTVDRPNQARPELFEIGFPILPFRRSEYRIRFEAPGGARLEATAPVQRSLEEMMRRHRDVGLEFAPVFVQRSSATNSEDFFVRFNFDGDWNGFNNAENLERGGTEIDLRAYVYYAVQETQVHYYLHYAYFHAVDPKFPGGHENDMEGVTVVVQKSDARVGTNREPEADRTALGAPAPVGAAQPRDAPNRFGKVVAMMALAHNDFTTKPAREFEIVAVSGDGTISFPAEDDPTRTHPVVDVESGSGQRLGRFLPTGKGHGARIAEAGALQRVLQSADGIIYVPGTSAQRPASSSSTAPVGFKLLSLTGDPDGDGVPDVGTDADGSGQPSNLGLWERSGDDRIFGNKREDYGLVADPQEPEGGGNTPVGVELGHGLLGDNGCQANLPWGWFELIGFFLPRESKGDLFLDPAGYFLKPAEGRIKSDGQFEDTGEAKYVWNVFLNRNTVFRGIRTSPGLSNFECNLDDQRCNVCLGGVRGLPNDFNKQLVSGAAADCTPEEVQACRLRLTSRGIPVP